MHIQKQEGIRDTGAITDEHPGEDSSPHTWPALGYAARPPWGQCGDREDGLQQLYLQPPLQRSAPAGPGVT